MQKNRIASLLAASMLAVGAVSLAAHADGDKKKDKTAQKDKAKEAKGHAAIEVGSKVPDFTATDANGKAVKFSDFAGKTVVLEIGRAHV